MTKLYKNVILDGAGQGNYLLKILLPLSKPVFAVVGLYYAVGYWNNKMVSD